MPTEDVIDRRIRREICKILWNIARGAQPGAAVRFKPGQLAAVDRAAVELMEMYEVAADQVIAELYEDWKATNRWADPSETHFAGILTMVATGLMRDPNLEEVLLKGRVPQFAIEMRGDDLVWTGDLADKANPNTRRPRRGRGPSLKCPCGAMMVPAGTVKQGGQTRYRAECPNCHDARYALAPYKRNPEIPTEEEYLGETLGSPSLTQNPPWQDLPGARRVLTRQIERSPEPSWVMDPLAPNLYATHVRSVDSDLEHGASRRRGLRGNPSFPSCPACGAKMHPGIGNTLVCRSCGVRADARRHGDTWEIDRITTRPPTHGERQGRPPGVPNPGHKFVGGHVVVWPRRTPTDQELADALRYITNEYTLADGGIDGEMWAEGLAFSRYPAGYAALEGARSMKAQLTDHQWQEIAARADYLRFEQGEAPRFAPEGFQ